MSVQSPSLPDQVPPCDIAAPVEVRALDDCTTLVTAADGSHHRVGLPAGSVMDVVRGWSLTDGAQPACEQTVELMAAAEPLRVLLAERAERVAVFRDMLRAVPTEAVDTLRVTSPIVVVGDTELVTLLQQLLLPTEAGHVSTFNTGEPWSVRQAVNRAYDADAMLLHVSRSDAPILRDIDRTCHDMRVPWVAMRLAHTAVWWGPCVRPGHSASYEDALARREAAAFDVEAHRALRSPSLTGTSGMGLPEAEVLLRQALSYVDAFAEDELLEITVDAEAGAPTVVTRRHPVLALPDSFSTRAPRDVSDLVDPVCGIITAVRNIRHHERSPSTLTTVQCDVADIRTVTRWANNTLCQGSSFNDLEGARRAAVGESVERYCANILDTVPNTFGSFHELLARGVQAVHPEEFVLHSSAQYEAPGFPFVPLTPDRPIHWVPSVSVITGQQRWVPASLVFVNWYSAGRAMAEPTNFCAFAGIAAGPSWEFAVMSGLEEIIERHATMVWWLNHHTLPSVPQPADVSAHLPSTDGQHTTLMHIDSVYDVPVMAALVTDDTDHLVNMGFATRHTPRDAALKAATEALTLQEGSRDLLRSAGNHWRAMRDGALNGRAFKAYREDRRYLDDFRDDMRDCDDLMVQQQVFLDRRAAKRVDHLLRPKRERSWESLPQLPERSLDAYRKRVESRGHDILVVDVTTADIASVGLSVVRVIVPGTVGNTPAAFPFLGRRVVQDQAVELGWRDSPLSENELNYFPMPHA